METSRKGGIEVPPRLGVRHPDPSSLEQIMNDTNATLVISATQAPVINVPDILKFETPIDPLPHGELDVAINPEDAELVLSYRYTEDREGAVYFFLTYEGIFLKAFAKYTIAQAVHYACSRTWKSSYRKLIPKLCKAVMHRFPNDEILSEEQLALILAEVL